MELTNFQKSLPRKVKLDKHYGMDSAPSNSIVNEWFNEVTIRDTFEKKLNIR